MIVSFKHKGLEALFTKGSKKGVNPDHAAKLLRVLDKLDSSLAPLDMNLPGYRLHELSGKDQGTWAVDISGNWRLTFRFTGENAIEVDYQDYH